VSTTAATYTAQAYRARLTSNDARRYALALDRTGMVRASAFHVGFSVSVVELRPLRGQPWYATRALRTSAECDAALAEFGGEA